MSTQHSGSLRDELVELINKAKLQDSKAKLETLAQVEEIVLHRERDLLNEFMPILLDFEIDRHVDVRRWLVNLLEQICKLDTLCTFPPPPL